MSTQYQNFGEFLQKKREAKQITLRKMAEMLKMSAPYLSDIEKGRRNPPEMDKLDQIAQILLCAARRRAGNIQRFIFIMACIARHGILAAAGRFHTRHQCIRLPPL